VIGELLPQTVVTVEAYGHEGADAPLYPEEAALMTRAVAKRRREFAVVRCCARRAMEKLGVPPQPVLPGERGDLASLGIDAEVHGPLPEGVLSAVALPAEAERLRRLAAQRPDIHWDRLLFSAKESVYKAWFPLTGKWLDFAEADIEITAGGPGECPRGTFRATLLVPGPRVGGRHLAHFDGHWTTDRGLVATAVVVPHD
jgi:4'-phosphopantetheinyl transferase EntD